MVPDQRSSHRGRSKVAHSATTSERSFYLYVLVLGNLIAVIGMTFLLLGILGALGLISAITDRLGGLGSSFASATAESAVLYSYAFLASVLSFAASWKMFGEGPRLWLLGLVTVLQLATAAAFHSGVSMLVAIPLAASIYGMVLLLLTGRTSRTAAAETAPLIPAQAPVTVPQATPVVPAQAVVDRPPSAMPPLLASEPVATAAVDPQQTVVHQPAPGVTERRRCADCGEVNPREARYCRACGSILPV